MLIPDFPRPPGRRGGFTMIEMMMVVAILGILAAVAVPMFSAYVRRSKTAEATTQLGNVFKSAAALYIQHNADERAVDASVVTNCVAPSAGPMPAVPSQNKQKFVSEGGFLLLPHQIADYVYYSYTIISVGDPGGLTCGFPAATAELYTFVAEGDLDGDLLKSRFELAVGSDAADALYHARGMYIVEEQE